MNNRSIRVIKVGGSLFDLPDLGSRISSWIVSEPPAFNLLIAGGGELVDAIRNQPIDDITAHWRCIELMTVTAESLVGVLPGIELLDALPESHCEATVIFSPTKWLREVEPNLPGTRLQTSWDVTSDSIAVRVAICLDADELVLFKSADPPNEDFLALAESGYVDRMFPKLAKDVPFIRIVNLRQFPSESLTRG